MERVATVSIGTEAIAYPFRILERVRVINDVVGGVDVVVIFERGVASALDRSEIPLSRDVGTVGVFARALNHRVLRFEMTGGQVIDTQTGSSWTILGSARAGPLKRMRLTPVVHGQFFWFSWAAFQPRTRVYSLP